MPMICYEQATRLGVVLRSIVRRYEPEGFDDPRYYPEKDVDPETVAMYFLVMVAMDHRLSRPGRPYEARLSGESLYHGADLLYRLGRRKLERDPSFFTADRLERVTVEDVRAWLCVSSACPPDAELRAGLLRDLGRKLKSLYGGSALRIVEESQGYLHTWNPEAPGFVEHLRVFEAYSDPVEKKPMLLAKFLERRGLLRIVDKWNKRVPVDNHLTRIALRTGIVELEPLLRIKVERQETFTPWEDVALRVVVREAWHQVALSAGVDDFVLDDILWSMGRKVCVHGRPLCKECKTSHPVCVNGVCILSELCPTGLRLREAIEEHLFVDTYWY